jgi:hypothetical protein
MSRAQKLLALGLICLTAAVGGACQSPTETASTLDVDDFVDAAAAPEPATGNASTDGKTYRVVRGNNQPDDILVYDWKASFAVTITLNSNSTSKDIDLSFPVTISSATVRVQQASGGIVTPPTGGETEHYESVITSSTTNKFAAANTSATLTFDVWYDLPSLQKEALATVTVTMRDDDGASFSKDITVRIN